MLVLRKTKLSDKLKISTNNFFNQVEKNFLSIKYWTNDQINNTKKLTKCYKN